MTPDELVSLYQSPDEIGDPPALRGLDEVNWSALEQAYGPATNIPALLRALVSGNSEHQDCACQDLLQTIWHQGTVYSATAVAVPFLFNLLEDDGPQDKLAIAGLLASVATGAPYSARRDGNPQELARMEAIMNRSLQGEIEAGRQVAAKIRELMAARIDLLYPYLRSRDPWVRGAVVRVIGTLPEIARRIQPVLEGMRERERDKFVRSALAQVMASLKPAGY